MSKIIRTAAFFLVGILIFIGMPLLAWGPDDLSGFFRNPSRLGSVVIAVLLNAYAAVEMASSERTRGTETKVVPRQRIVVFLMGALTLAVVIAGPFCDRRGIAVFGESAVLRGIGLAVYAVGFVLMNLAHSQLGKQFSVQVARQQDHRLVTGGLYRRIRHPRYLGIMVFCLGASLLFRSAVALVITAPLIAVLFWRIHDEEAFMRREFGAEWETYARRTCRLIPFVY